MKSFLESRELIRRLKEGSPIEVDGEVVRLPRFSEIQEAQPGDFGAKGKQDLIVAKARTATWCVWPLNRRAKFQKKDSEGFTLILKALEESIPDKPVVGWVLTTGPIDDAVRAKMNEDGHRVNRVPL
ncbi:MAG: hypothetical protein V3W41_17125 [Planctomycetota bacterium]